MPHRPRPQLAQFFQSYLKEDLAATFCLVFQAESTFSSVIICTCSKLQKRTFRSIFTLAHFSDLFNIIFYYIATQCSVNELNLI